MTVKKVTVVEYYTPGFFFANPNLVEVENRSTDTLQIPDGVFGFRFYTIYREVKDGKILESEKQDASPLYYCSGRVMTLAEVESEMPEAKTLIWNMKTNKYDRIVLLETGNAYVLDEEDIYLERS